MIKLDSNYTLKPDKYKGFILTFEDKVIKKVKGVDTECKKRDEWHYPLLSQILNKYMQLSLNSSESLEDLKNNLIRVEESIQNFRK